MTLRLDRALVERGLARSRQQAAEAIRGGRVRVNQAVAGKASITVGPDDLLELTGADHYVARSAHKLIAALDGSGQQVPARVLDGGASTGGFTQVLLERGAERVFAVDVGHGQLAPQLRADPRVVVREGLNLRGLQLGELDGDPVGLVVADVSFISLRLLLEPLFGVIAPGGAALVLVKPQFEVGRGGLDDRGVVRDPRLRRRAIRDVVDAAAGLGWTATWQADSPLSGEHGNLERMVQFRRAGDAVGAGR